MSASQELASASQMLQLLVLGVSVGVVVVADVAAVAVGLFHCCRY